MKDSPCQGCSEWVEKFNEMREDRDTWRKSAETLHARFVALENQLAESRRNFAIIAKLLRGTE